MACIVSLWLDDSKFTPLKADNMSSWDMLETFNSSPQGTLLIYGRYELPTKTPGFRDYDNQPDWLSLLKSSHKGVQLSYSSVLSIYKMHIVEIPLTGSAHGQSLDRNSNAAERTKYGFTFSYLLIVHQVKGLSSVEFLVYS
jgi:hypothetical protein